MRQVNRVFAVLLLVVCHGVLRAQNGGAAPDAQREKFALLALAKIVENNVVSVAEAMPADKYGFVPTEGEFQGVRTFGQQLCAVVVWESAKDQRD